MILRLSLAAALLVLASAAHAQELRIGFMATQTGGAAITGQHAPYPSVRGYFPYNVNGLPIVDFYKREVVRGGDGKPQIVTRATVVKASKDPYWQECPERNRL